MSTSSSVEESLDKQMYFMSCHPTCTVHKENSVSLFLNNLCVLLLKVCVTKLPLNGLSSDSMNVFFTQAVDYLPHSDLLQNVAYSQSLKVMCHAMHLTHHVSIGLISGKKVLYHETQHIVNRWKDCVTITLR